MWKLYKIPQPLLDYENKEVFILICNVNVFHE